MGHLKLNKMRKKKPKLSSNETETRTVITLLPYEING